MRLDRSTLAIATLALASAAGCVPDDRPEPPAIFRDVALIDDEVRFTHPYVPGHRTTMDGRVGIRVQGGPPGTETIATSLSFYLFAPEKLTEPIMGGPAGALILADPTPVDLAFPPALDPAVQTLGHHAICDPTEEFARPGEHTNPSPCASDPARDCYDFTVISTTADNVLGSRVWGTPVHVEVEQPKTANARIVHAELGEPVQGTFIPLNNEFTEPAVTMDGRLLTGRLGRAPRKWTNPETGETLVRQYDLAYAQLPDDAEPCDVTGWTTFHPMSHAPYDSRMVGRYGLAAYPFRDTEGRIIPDGEDLGGTYPWVDREGANVFMAGVPGRLVEQSETAYPRRCVTPGCETYSENTDWDRGFQVGGLWTHGKFVHLDGMINNQDWAVGVTPASHWWVDLYRDAEGADVPVRFGSGRFIDRVRNAGGPYPPGYSHNANILDSVQNLPNHAAAAHPVTPRDVVWIMSTGVGTDEVVFDDYLDPDALILSNMQATITPIYTESGISLATPKHWNGQVRKLKLPLSIPSLYELFPEQREDIHIQNAATSPGWKVPAFGRVTAGTGRAEPVALGGIQGRGFWLTGANEIRYAMPAQTRSVSDADGYLGIFLDPRFADDEHRAVASFPDGSELHVSGHAAVRYVVDGEVIREIALPPGDGWMHLGLRIRDRHRLVTLLHDGFPVDVYASPLPLFRPVAGDLVVGASASGAASGFRGWIDELKLLAHDVNPEVACNHAHGTLIGVSDDPGFTRAAERYPAWARDEIARAAGLSPDERAFVCYHDYSADYAAHLGNLPPGSISLRGPINFPEGPVRAGAPRPDSSANPFCLGCHTPHGKGGLTVAALEPHDVLAENDPRRQPLQPPRRVFGNVPPGWIPPGPGPGSPDSPVTAPPEGLLVDRWLLPDASARAADALTRHVHRH